MNNFGYQDPRSSQQPVWNEGGYGFTARTAADVSVAERMGFIRKVYSLFFLGIFFAFGGVAVGFTVPSVMIAIAEHPFITLLVLLGAVMGCEAVRHVKGVNLLALFGFTALTGVVGSPLLAIIALKNPASILLAGGMTVLVFGGLTAYAFISKKDMSFLGGMLFTGLLVILGGGLLNIFIGSGALAFGLAAGTLILFSGYVLYDTSQIIHRYQTNEYISAALSLYLDAFNIFFALLRLLNAGRD